MSVSRPSSPVRAAAAALAGLLCLALPAAAQPAAAGPDDTPAPAVAPAPAWYEAISLNAFVSASWGVNLNRPASGTNAFRAFDVENRSIQLDVASLVVQKKAEKPGEAGFRLDALAGSSVPRATAASGLFRDPETGDAGDFDLLEAFVRWVAPLGSGLKLDVGKFVTSVGLEPIEGPDARGDHATHSFLFTFSEPSTHTGLKAGYAFSDLLAAELLLVNGWDDAQDRNGAKTVGAGLTVTPGAGWTLAANLLHGPEQEGNDADDRSLVSVTARLEPGGAFRAAVSLDWGREEGPAEGGATASWWGVAGYVGWELSPSFAVGLRADRFDDADGVRTGTAQRLVGLTFTPTVTLGSGFVVRADLRVDLSDEEVFEDEDGLFTQKRQPTVLLNALYAF